MDIAAFCRCIVSVFSLYEHAYGRSLAPRSRKVFFSIVIAKLSSPFHENVLLVVESYLDDFSFDLCPFVRSASLPLLSTSLRRYFCVMFFHNKTREKRYDTRTKRHRNFFRTRASGGRIKHPSCHQNPLARRLHLRLLKRRRPMDSHRFPKTAS